MPVNPLRAGILGVHANGSIDGFVGGYSNGHIYVTCFMIEFRPDLTIWTKMSEAVKFSKSFEEFLS